jgi:DNA-binding SARP family transcriptional activator/tetratricopeptide (TPR) repeat protein
VIQLYTYGDALIHVGPTKVRPSSPMVFAALLYLSVERGRRVPRQFLQKLLFADGESNKGSHSLRQLLYKLRRLGVPLSADASDVCIPAHLVQDTQLTDLRHGGVLPGYTPAVTEAFAKWVEAYRDTAAIALRAQLLPRLEQERARGNADSMLAVASAVLSLDPLNEEAVLVRAEGLALRGQKLQAIQVLDAYSKELGDSCVELRLPVEVLRRRISTRVSDHSFAVPLLGRAHELAELLDMLNRAAAGFSNVFEIVGEAGVGKSRLLTAFRSHIALRPAASVAAQCREHDQTRPLGVVMDLVPTVLELRGAASVSPDVMSVLRRLLGSSSPEGTLGPSEVMSGRIGNAIEELFGAVAAETTLCITIDDAQRIDDASLALLFSVPQRVPRLMVVLATRFGLSTRVTGALSQRHCVRRLTPLSDDVAGALLRQLIGNATPLTDEVMARCTALASGNALFLHAIADHLRVHGAAPHSQATLTDLLRHRLRPLSPEALLLLRSVATLGAHCTTDRLQRCSGLPRDAYLLALQEAADLKLVVGHSGTIQCTHELIAEFVASDTPTALRPALMERAARVLEHDGKAQRNTAALWSAAHSYQAASLHAQAASSLIQCAEIAVATGQPRFAIDALEMAQTCAEEPEVEDLVGLTLRVADDACENDAVRTNVERLRVWRSRRGLPPMGNVAAEVALINTRRRSMQSVWNDHPTLVQCLESRHCALADRVKAARVLFLVAEEQMERTLAAQVFETAQATLRPIVTPSEWRHLELAYHGTFGSLDQAIHVAEELIELRTRQFAHVSMIAYGHAGYLLFRAGTVDKALAVYEELIAESQRLRINPFTAGNYAAQAAMMALHSGDTLAAVGFQEQAKNIFASTGDSFRPVVLANEIDLAIASNRPDEGRNALRALAEKYADCFTPNRERISTGHELILDWMEGAPSAPLLCARATVLFEAGRQICECDTLAVGLALQNARQNASGALEELDTYVRSWRRDRYPLAPFHRDALETARISASAALAFSHS